MQRTTFEAQQVKAGDAASREESRDVKRYGRGLDGSDAGGLTGSDAGKPWRRCHGGWLVARGVMRTVTRSSSSKTAVGVSTKGSQQCKRSILQRVLGARNRDPIAAGDENKADREAVSQGVSGRFTRNDDETRASSQGEQKV